MADLQKTIKGLEDWIDAPFAMNAEIDPQLVHDALELLKERVKTPVFFKKNKDGYFVDPECGHCGQYLDKAYSFCPKCKKELDWNV